MFEQRSEEGPDAPPASESPDEGQGAEAARSADVYPCYSLEVLRLLED
jgi:hypothetical protein